MLTNADPATVDRSRPSQPTWDDRNQDLIEEVEAAQNEEAINPLLQTEDAEKVLVATETGMLHQLRKVNPTTIFEPVNRAAVCKYMKMITPAKLLSSLQDGTDEVMVDKDIADRARTSVERMISIGTPSPTAE